MKYFFIYSAFMILFVSNSVLANEKLILNCEAPEQTTINKFSGQLLLEVNDNKEVSSLIRFHLLTAGGLSSSTLNTTLTGNLEVIPAGLLVKGEVNSYTLSNYEGVANAQKVGLKILEGKDVMLTSSVVIDSIQYFSYCHL